MLKDITLGQYFPGNSLLHRLDPRMKIFLIVLYIVTIFSRIYGGWINIGFKTGGMDSVMKRIGDAYNDEIDHRIHRFVSILEPTLVIILSIFIGLILISFLLPLLGIMSSIG